MDVNLNAEVKGFGVPATTAVEREEKTKPPVTPIEGSNGSAKGALDEKAMQGHGKSAEEVAKAVEQIQEKLDSMGTRLNFTLHEDPNAVVVQVTDRQSGELIRQFPPEKALQLRSKLVELVGILFDEKA